MTNPEFTIAFKLHPKEANFASGMSIIGAGIFFFPNYNTIMVSFSISALFVQWHMEKLLL